LFLFGFCGNISNIAINTQAVSVEGIYQRPIMASFHGLWSVAGFSAAFIGSFMISYRVIPLHHFIIILTCIIVLMAVSIPSAIKTVNKKGASSKIFVLPEKSLLKLGIIAFCSMICEGAMFDWSGVYFNKVIMAGMPGGVRGIWHLWVQWQQEGLLPTTLLIALV